MGRQHERVRAGSHLQVDVGEVGRLGAPRIDHHQRARRVLGQRVQHLARAGEAV
jgi:hypothetical protein